MNKETFLSQFIKTAGELVTEGILQPNGCISALFEKNLFITGKDANLAKLSANEIAEMTLDGLTPQNGIIANSEYHLHAAIYLSRSDITAIVHSTQLSCMTSSKAGITVKPLLDDMAQIAGITVKCVDCPDNATPEELNSLIKAIKGRNAVLIKNSGALCGSSSLEDAHAVAMVMEKATKAFIETEFLGGAFVIPKWEAALMRFVYLKKYSKKTTQNKK